MTIINYLPADLPAGLKTKLNKFFHSDLLLVPLHPPPRPAAQRMALLTSPFLTPSSLLLAPSEVLCSLPSHFLHKRLWFPPTQTPTLCSWMHTVPSLPSGLTQHRTSALQQFRCENSCLELSVIKTKERKQTSCRHGAVTGPPTREASGG